MDGKMWNEFRPYWERENPDSADPLDKERAQNAMTKAYSITYSESEASIGEQKEESRERGRDRDRERGGERALVVICSRKCPSFPLMTL